MKHHSILTTLFPRLPIARRSISQILGELNIDLEKAPGQVADLLPGLGTVEVDDGGGEAWVFIPNVLPAIEICGKTVRCHLDYSELPKDGPELLAANNKATVEIHLSLLSEGKIELELWPQAEVAISRNAHNPNDASEIFRRFWSILLRDEVSFIDFRIDIVVAAEDCPSYCPLGLAPQEREAERAALRREHVARELTTGYRRYVSLLIMLMSAAAYKSSYQTGGVRPKSLIDATPSCHVVHESSAKPQLGELHSTREDAWRLLCTFHSVEVAAKKINSSLFGTASNQYVLSLQQFVSSLTETQPEGITPTAVALMDHLFFHKQIKRDISLRKTLEYYIFEAIPNMPS